MSDAGKIISPWDDESAFSVALDTEKFGTRTQGIYDFMSGRVIGQERACRFLARDLAMSFSGMNDPLRPMGVYILTGPTGVGKTLFAEETARAMIYDDPDEEPPFTKADCGKMHSDHQLNEFIGAPPSYIGYDKQPKFSQIMIDQYDFWVKFTQWCRRNDLPKLDDNDMKEWLANWYATHGPYTSVVLIDEVEKAHERMLQALLEVTDKGRLGMNNGQVAFFRNSVVFLTCNLGQARIQELIKGKSRVVGFQASHALETRLGTDRAILDETIKEIERAWPAELVGRVRNKIIVFRTLDREQRREAMEKTMLSRVISRAVRAAVPVKLLLSPGFKEMLLDEGTNDAYGLRPLRDTVDRFVSKPLANIIESGQVQSNELVMCRMVSGKPELCRLKRSEDPEPASKDG